MSIPEMQKILKLSSFKDNLSGKKTQYYILSGFSYLSVEGAKLESYKYYLKLNEGQNEDQSGSGSIF
jgi:hypothetical protein